MTAKIPQAGEVWRTKSGRTREVSFVQNENDLQDDGRWCFVHYTRPKPAEEAFAITTLKQWWEWVEREQAVLAVRTWRVA